MAGRYEVDLSERGELARALEQSLPAGGVLVPAEKAPPLFARVALRVRLPGGAAFDLDGQVVNPAPGRGFFVRFEDEAAASELVRAARAAVTAWGEGEGGDGGDEGEGDEDGDGGDGGEGGAGDEDGEDGEGEGGAGDEGAGTPPRQVMKAARDLVDPRSDVPLYKQIGDLSPGDRVRVAHMATYPMRRILVHDIDKRVHMALLKNPKIRDEEITAYSGLAGLSPRALQWIAAHDQYVRKRRVLMNLVLNPSTPQDTVINKLMGRLTQRELFHVMRSPQVREAVSRAARVRLMRAGII